MSYFLLNNFWFVFNYVFKPLGVYPCQKSETAKLRPTSSCKFWTRYICTSTLIYCILMSIMSYIVNFQTTPEKYMEAYFQKLIPSMLDKVVMLTIILPTFIVNLICLAKFKSLAVGLSEFQDFINSKRVFGVNAVKNETSRWALITFLLFVSASIIVRLGNYYLMNTLLQMSHFWVITLSMVESTLTH